ncbi:MAG: DNA methyltransferase [Bdellovibrionales bacterium]|nr:DNA methyltransferase [Bdellovibrionales bacterium]
MRLIETDNFEFEFLSQLAERESWRKEIHRPVYYLHKWWAKRLGSVFRGILLGSLLSEKEKLSENFYSLHDFSDVSVFDPFMGSGVTIGEAHKLGLTALGRDINPVAVESVRVAFGPINKEKADYELEKLKQNIGRKILKLYRSTDSNGYPCDVLYYFWVMQANCPRCDMLTDLFSSWVIAKNAYPDLKPAVQILCPSCGNIFLETKDKTKVICSSCNLQFAPNEGNVKHSKVECSDCHYIFPIISSCRKNIKPKFRLFGKLVFTKDEKKEYLKTNEKDIADFNKASEVLKTELQRKTIILPKLKLENGYNTKQAMNYGFVKWKDFFNDRQLLGLGWLHNSITKIKDKDIRDLFLLAFSSALEFNNMFASYKGEGTGAVRHIFSHHILKPERKPIETNIWGTPKSSGSFFNLFQNRIKRAILYRQKPTEINQTKGDKALQCSSAFTEKVDIQWPTKKISLSRKVYLSCGNSSTSHLPDNSIDLVVTDPPFFDNVHYSELADFFYSWQQLVPRGFINGSKTTRCPMEEVQDYDSTNFTKKLQNVFQECHRILKDDGMLVFTYHHSRGEGWQSVIKAILESGFFVINSHPVKSEMSVATPKSQAKNPIQLDIIIVCRKNKNQKWKSSIETALRIAEDKISRLNLSGFSLSSNDKKIIRYGQLLTVLQFEKEIPL